jgi:Tol biopolymer transport system component
MVATTHSQTKLKSFLLLSISLLLSPLALAQAPSETLLSTDNGYNPIPSPDGKLIAYVRTGWGRSKGSGGFGRSNLVSEVAIIDAAGGTVTTTLLSDSFLSGWTPDGTKLACYRDWEYALISLDGRKTTSGHIPNEAQRLSAATEWAAYSPSQATMVWSRKVDESHSSIESPDATVARTSRLIGPRVVPSPDGRYFAVFGEQAESHLWVYDTQLESWTDLAKIRIHPNPNWSYIQPSWNPWFADGSHLVYFSDSVLTVSSPDGRQKTEIRIDAEAGLPTPSPDGLSVAFVTFEPRPMRARSDLSFWGNSTIWVVSPVPGAQPRAVTQKDPDETYDLRWLNNEALVFDRIADESFYQHARLWETSVPR